MQLRNGKIIGTTFVDSKVKATDKKPDNNDLETIRTELVKMVNQFFSHFDIKERIRTFFFIYFYIDENLETIANSKGQSWLKFLKVSLDRFDTNMPAIIQNKHLFQNYEFMSKSLEVFRKNICNAIENW